MHIQEMILQGEKISIWAFSILLGFPGRWSPSSWQLKVMGSEEVRTARGFEDPPAQPFRFTHETG